MSWEKVYTGETKCPCGTGKLFEEGISDDWGQYRTSRYINCPKCKSLYHYESDYVTGSGEIHEKVYLVRNAETLRIHRTNNAVVISFEEAIAERYSLSGIKHAYEILIGASTYKNISSREFCAREIMREHKYANKTMKMREVRENVSNSILKYHDYEYNQEKVEKMKKEVLSRSFGPIYFDAIG